MAAREDANAAARDIAHGAPGRAEDAVAPDALLTDAERRQGLGAITPADEELLTALDEINGQDAYSAEVMALGALARGEFLAVPSMPPVIPPESVGRRDAHRRFSYMYLAQVYALNAARAPPGEDKARFGLVRMEAVKMGWYADQREVEIVTPPVDAMRQFLNDATPELIKGARRTAFLIPMVAEHTFRTMGHHYLTSQAADYEERYRKTLAACLAPDVANFMRPATLYHAVLHWVSPARARDVEEAQKELGTLPDAIVIRMSAAPAGTALVTTSAAVLNSMATCNALEPVIEAGVADVKEILEVAKIVKEKPARYHKMAHAFGVAPATKEELLRLEVAKAQAIILSPICQGYIDALMKNAALGNAKALLKHAEQSPVLRKRAQTFFKALGKTPVATLKELLTPEVAKVAVVKGEG
jgi:hypothetical protein